MLRARVKWPLILALPAALIGIGCSGENGAPETELGAGAAGQPVAEGVVEASPVTTPRAITPAELVTRMEGPDAPVILDVRSPEEYTDGHIPGAINVPYDQIGARIGSLEEYRDGDLVVYCRTGRRAGVAERALREAGFEQIWDLEGHMVAWREAELPLAVPAACC